MITRVFAVGFKGGDFDQPLGKHTLFLGMNGAGKSSRAEALMLAVNGAIPGGPKTNPDIFAAFGSGDEMTVGFDMNSYTFEREYIRRKDTVTQVYKINGKKASKEFFFQTIGEKGKPRVIDLADFIALSDQKKIDAILNLFPPTEDVTPIVTAMEKAKLDLNDAVAKLKAQEAVCASLKAQRATMQLPATTLSAATEEIQNVEGILAKAHAELAEAEKQEAVEAERKRAEEAAAKAEADRKAKEAAKKPDPPVQAPAQSPATPAPTGGKPAEVLPMTAAKDTNEPVISSILAIIRAMDEAGCGACAAKLVAKRELRKYIRGEVSHGQAVGN